MTTQPATEFGRNPVWARLRAELNLSGWVFPKDGKPWCRCACGHPVHPTGPCDAGVVVRDEEGPCGCPPTCAWCQNSGWYTRRVRDQNEPQSCRCQAQVLVA